MCREFKNANVAQATAVSETAAYVCTYTGKSVIYSLSIYNLRFLAARTVPNTLW